MPSLRSMVVGALLLVPGSAGMVVSPAQAAVFACAPCYVEVGDAGGLDNPQLITGGPYNGITGNLGDPSTDTVDVFGFAWLGGDFQAFVNPGSLYLSLFDAQKNLEGTIAGSVLSYPGLEPGNYYLKVALAPNDPDPPFTFGLFELTPGPSQIVAFVPAPPAIALVLLGLGLAGLAARRIRR